MLCVDRIIDLTDDLIEALLGDTAMQENSMLLENDEVMLLENGEAMLLE